MKKWMKTAFAAFIGAAICTAAGSLSASADVTPDGDTLILSGNVTVDEVQAYANNEAVKKVVCEPGTVFPEYHCRKGKCAADGFHGRGRQPGAAAGI